MLQWSLVHITNNKTHAWKGITFCTGQTNLKQEYNIFTIGTGFERYISHAYNIQNILRNKTKILFKQGHMHSYKKKYKVKIEICSRQ